MGINNDFKALLKDGLKRTIPSLDVFLEAVIYKTNNEIVKTTPAKIMSNLIFLSKSSWLPSFLIS